MHGTRALPPPPSFGALCREGPVGIFLDFDGTLVELAATPDGIAVPGHLNRSLFELSGRLDGRLALVSGRAITDLERHLGPIEVAKAGSHGADRLRADGQQLDIRPESLPESLMLELRAVAERLGLHFEHKPHGAALHYRSRPEMEKEGLEASQALAQRHELVVKRGKYVIELVRPGADKGGAVRAFMEYAPFAGSRPIFVGDDVTDEDGFAAVADLGGIGILVGDREPSAAEYRLSGPEQVHEWLGL